MLGFMAVGERLKVQRARPESQGTGQRQKAQARSSVAPDTRYGISGGISDIIAISTCLRTEWNVLHNEAFGAQRVTPDHPASVRWNSSCPVSEEPGEVSLKGREVWLT